MKKLTNIIFVMLAVLWAYPAHAASSYKLSAENYTVPNVTLVNQTGVKVALDAALNSGKPVLIDFIFTTCTTICPVLSANFINFQNKLSPELEKAQLVSISIDPENDTPKKCAEYLKQFNAKPGWDYLTGRRADIDKVIKAFDASATNKMAHLPIIIIWSPAKKSWTRIDGLISTAELIEEYKKATSR